MGVRKAGLTITKCGTNAELLTFRLSISFAGNSFNSSDIVRISAPGTNRPQRQQKPFETNSPTHQPQLCHAFGQDFAQQIHDGNRVQII